LLGLSFRDLRVIEANNPADNNSCCDQILKRWLEIKGTAATWKKLSAAIDSSSIKGFYKAYDKI